jgi:hypothetical protein
MTSFLPTNPNFRRNQTRVHKIPPEREKTLITRVTRMKNTMSMRMVLMRKRPSKLPQRRMRAPKPIIMKKKTILRDALRRQMF